MSASPGGWGQHYGKGNLMTAQATLPARDSSAEWAGPW